MQKLFDTDRHVAEPLNLWQQKLPAEYMAYAPEIRSENELHEIALRTAKYGPRGSIPIIPQTYVNGQPLYNKFSEKARIEASYLVEQEPDRTQTAATGEGQLSSMDAMGVDVSFLFPGDATYLVNNDIIPAEVSAVFAEIYNNWLKNYIQAAPDRLVPVGVVSRHAPDLMLKELLRIDRWGWKNIVLRPEQINGRTLGHPDYEAFWQACEDLSISVCIKGGTHLHGTTVGLGHFDSRFALHASSHYLEAHLAFLSLLESGVLERHPQLRFAFMEAGASFWPAWLWRLDHVCYEHMPGELSDRVKMPPSEYFKRQCWTAFELEEPGLDVVVKTLGMEKLLWGTDFPHFDHDEVDAKNLTSDQFSKEQLNSIQCNNPLGFFRI